MIPRPLAAGRSLGCEPPVGTRFAGCSRLIRRRSPVCPKEDLGFAEAPSILTGRGRFGGGPCAAGLDRSPRGRDFGLRWLRPKPLRVVVESVDLAMVWPLFGRVA